MNNCLCCQEQEEIKQIAFLCPGQGSQAVGMLDQFLKNTITKSKIEQASSILNKDLIKISRDKDLINQTVNTQPIVFVASIVAAIKWFTHKGEKPSYIAGHSLGEYSALAISGVLTYEDALKLVQVRANAMQECTQNIQSSMSAIIGLDDEKVEQICIEACQNLKDENEIVSAANFNAPKQVVISGTKKAVLEAEEISKKMGGKAIKIQVSVPSHSALMKNASQVLEEELKKISFYKAQIPVIQNVNAKSEENPENIKENLIKQLTKPVQWTQSIKFLTAKNIYEHVECGYGKILSGLSKRIDPKIKTIQLQDSESNY